MAKTDCKPLPDLSSINVDLFWSKIKIVPGDGCWEWQAGVNIDGYGIFHVKCVQFRSPRICYMISSGTDPFPYDILHTCDNRRCCRPTHLFIGTKKDNAIDACSKNRQIKGENHYNNKYTDEQVQQVKELLSLRPAILKPKDIAEITGVGIRSVYAIKYGARHLET